MHFKDHILRERERERQRELIGGKYFYLSQKWCCTYRWWHLFQVQHLSEKKQYVIKQSFFVSKLLDISLQIVMSLYKYP